MVAGALRVTASSEVGGLGAATGPAAAFEWTRPSLMPLLLPWLGLLVLLTRRENRGWPAWWVCLPLAAVTALIWGARPLFSFVPSTALDLFCESLQAVAFGVAAVWLLSNLLGSVPSRVAVFFGTILVLGGFSLLAYAVRQDWSGPEAAGGLMLLGFFGGASALALSLAGRACQRRYAPLRLSCWVYAWLAAALMAVAAPFFLLAALSGGPGWREGFFFLVTVLTLATATFTVLLPFLVLAFASPFYRRRIEALLHVSSAAPPALASAGG
jgi:hypothetical protein